MTDSIRLAKHIAKSVPCSRREAEIYIVGGWVTVDEKVVEEPQFKVSQQKVKMRPEANLDPIESVTILFHSSTSHPPQTVTLRIRNHYFLLQRI